MRLCLVFLILSFSLFAQGKDSSAINSVPIKTSGNTNPQDNAKQLTPDKDPNADIFNDLDLDKEFYTYYFLNLPKFEQKDTGEDKKLSVNLIKAFKGEISKRDPSLKNNLDDINLATVKYRRVSEDSVWMKRIKQVMGYIQFTQYMYIIKYRKYIALVTYKADPRLHIQTAHWVELIVGKDSSPKDPYAD
jgi:hypothetical protein